jgi:tetratricopeptide (TPR) repeat protein
LQSVANAPEIEYIDRVLDEKQLAGLYTACDCLVHPYRGEGFGLPIIEAMSSGLPAIVTGHGAALDFCNNDNSYLISAREVRWPKKQVGNEETVDFPWWAEPDRESLRHWVKHVVANLNEAKEKGVAARAFILNHFTWQQASQILQERIHNLCLKPVRRFSDEIRWQRQLEKGEELFEKCEYEQAEQLFAGIMAENPKHVQARNNYACLLWQTGRLEQAATEFRRAFELDPNDRDLAWNAGQFLSATGFVTEAREIYSNYLSGHPQEKEMREQMQVWEVGSTCLPAQAGRADPEINPDRVPNPVRVISHFTGLP